MGLPAVAWAAAGLTILSVWVVLFVAVIVRSRTGKALPPWLLGRRKPQPAHPPPSAPPAPRTAQRATPASDGMGCAGALAFGFFFYIVLPLAILAGPVLFVRWVWSW